MLYYKETSKTRKERYNIMDNIKKLKELFNEDKTKGNIKQVHKTVEGLFNKYSEATNLKGSVFNQNPERKYKGNTTNEGVKRVSEETSEVYLGIISYLVSGGICFNYNLEDGKPYLPYIEVIKPNDLTHIIKVVEDSKCEPMYISIVKKVSSIEVLSYSYKLEDIIEVYNKVK